MNHIPPPAPLHCTCAYRLDACPVHGTKHIQYSEPAFAPPPPPPSVAARIPAPTPAPPPLPPSAQAQEENPQKRRINVRSKGQRGEREVVKLLQTVVDKVRAKYHLEPLVLQRNSLQAHLGGADLHGLDGFSVEVKFVEKEALPQWWRQTVRQAEDKDAVPILFYRGSHMPWSVKFRAFVNTPLDRDQIEMDLTTELEDFLAWFEEAYDEAMCDKSQRLK
jgi:hypothetical protein